MLISEFFYHFIARDDARIFFDVSSIPFDQPQSTWNVDDGYDESRSNLRAYPYRTIDVGLQNSLTIILKVNNNDLDYLCGGTVQGFRIGFHSPIDIPRELKKFFELSPKHATLYVIEPKLIRTSNETRKFSPHERQCFFNYEHKLRFFKQYTQMNCVSECISNYTLAQCGCVHFSMLRRLMFFSRCCLFHSHDYLILPYLILFDANKTTPRRKWYRSLWNSKNAVLHCS